MSISIDPEVLLDERRALLRHTLALTSVELVAPQTGDTTDLTAAALGRVAAVVASLATDLLGLADAVATVVADLERSDDQVTAWFHLLRIGRLV